MQNFNIVTIVVYLLIAVIFVIWWLILKGREDYIKKRENIVGQRECNCDRRAELLDAAENDLEMRYGNATKWIADSVEFNASYVVTDSDEIKYSSEQAVRKEATKRIARNLVYDIIKRFEPKEEKNEFGRTKFSYHFKVVEDK